MTKILRILFLAFFAACAFAVSTFSQGTVEKATPCEYVKHSLDYSVIDGNKNRAANVIFIFRRGNRETGKTLIRDRMNLIEKYLTYKDATLQFLFAEGKSANGLGKIEIYVEGKLSWEILIKKNDIRLCEEEPMIRRGGRRNPVKSHPL